MKAFVFPGQGAQFAGMGKELYEESPLARELFEKANEILGFRITDIMFDGSDEDLRQTRVTQPAGEELKRAIDSVSFQAPDFPVYQNVSTQGETKPERIKDNLIAQLTAPVKWTQSVQNMIATGADDFTELGPGSVLQGLIKKINPAVQVHGIS